MVDEIPQDVGELASASAGRLLQLLAAGVGHLGQAGKDPTGKVTEQEGLALRGFSVIPELCG
ncbi:MAG TPA: hypothetical protein VI365_14830 [Trebonia sp.]